MDDSQLFTALQEIIQLRKNETDAINKQYSDLNQRLNELQARYETDIQNAFSKYENIIANAKILNQSQKPPSKPANSNQQLTQPQNPPSKPAKSNQQLTQPSKKMKLLKIDTQSKHIVFDDIKNELKPKENVRCFLCDTDFHDSSDDFILTDCSHIFHKSCYELWTKNSDVCPRCQKKL